MFICVRTLKGSWCRLKAELPVNHQKRQIIIESCVRLHNVRARFDLFNQIRTVFANPDFTAITALNRGGIGERQTQFWNIDTE